MKKILLMITLTAAAFVLIACTGTRNQKPVITVADLEPTILIGEEFDPLEGVTVTDDRDENLIEDLVITGWDETDSTDNAGSYTIVYSVTDKDGLEATPVTVNLTINNPQSSDTTPPVFAGVILQQEIYVGSEDWTPLDGVTASDDIDGDLTDEIEVLSVLGTHYFLDVPGTYQIKLRVRNEAGLIASVTISLKVLASPIPASIPTSEVTITMWHAMGSFNQGLLTKYAQAFHDYYESEYGYNFNVVIADGKSNYDTLKTDMIYAITAGNIPNLVQGYPDHVAEYLSGNAVVNLNPYIYDTTWGLNGDDALDDIIPSYLEENSQYDLDGTYYSLPFNKSTEIMIYNSSVLNELELDAPTTWQDIIQMAPQLNAWATANEISQFVPASYDSTGNAFITFTRQWNGAYTGINFSNFQGQYLWRDNANTTAAMNFLKTNKNVITLPEYWQQQYASTPFVNQQTMVTIGSSAGVTYNIPGVGKWDSGTIIPVDQPATPAVNDKWFDEAKNSLYTWTGSAWYEQTDVPTIQLVDKPETTDKDESIPVTGAVWFNESTNTLYYADPIWNIGVDQVPYNALSPEHRAVIQQGTNVSVLKTGTDVEKFVSWLFLKWIISTENTLDWAMSTGYLPVRTSAYESAIYQNFIEHPETVFVSGRNKTQVAAIAAASKAAYLQSPYFYFDPAFIGSSRARNEVGLALTRIMTGDGNIQQALHDAYVAASLGQE